MCPVLSEQVTCFHGTLVLGFLFIGVFVVVVVVVMVAVDVNFVVVVVVGFVFGFCFVCCCCWASLFSYRVVLCVLFAFVVAVIRGGDSFYKI